MTANFKLRPAGKSDKKAIELLCGYHENVHRHLDWRSPTEWLGEQPYLLLEVDYSVQAALACPCDPPGIAWIRFFAASPSLQLKPTWKLLFDSALDGFAQPPDEIVSVAVHPWYTRLLLDQGFTLLQTIIVLQLNTPLLHPLLLPRELTLRAMSAADCETVAGLDHESFEVIWQNSLEATRFAYKESSYATIAYWNQQPVGYQISSSTPFNAHLSRLAVIPGMQGKGIGSLLARDMILHYRHRGIAYITVNTQSDNEASLHLYRKLGFQLTNERFPVLRYTA